MCIYCKYDELVKQFQELKDRNSVLEAELEARRMVSDLRYDNIENLIEVVNERDDVIAAAERELGEYLPESYVKREIWAKWSLAEKTRDVVTKLKMERDNLRDEVQHLQEGENRGIEAWKAVNDAIRPHLEDGDYGAPTHVVIRRIINRLTSRINELWCYNSMIDIANQDLSEIVALYQDDTDDGYSLPERALCVINRLANSIIAMRRSLGHALDVSKLSVPQ